MEDKELLQCPYEKCHRILKHRMQIHLIKCRRNHLGVPKVTCPFNVTHILNEPELEFHVTVCTDRTAFEKFCSVEDGSTVPTVPPPMDPCGSEENWDHDDAPTYNPSEYAAKASILREIKGAQPAERKQFRKQERLRLLGMED